MIKKFLALVTIVITFTLGITGHPQEKSTYRFQVYVEIKADESLKSLIESYIKRELRSLQDVDIVYTRDGMPYEIVVVAMEMETVSGRKTGSIAFAVNFQRQLRSGLYSLPYLMVQTGDRTYLDGMCKNLVAKFDTDYLEQRRKYIRTLEKKN
jgi:hypothetical protein